MDWTGSGYGHEVCDHPVGSLGSCMDSWTVSHTQTRTFWSQEHVATAIPFVATDSDVMRFSWPARQPKTVNSWCTVSIAMNGRGWEGSNDGLCSRFIVQRITRQARVLEWFHLYCRLLQYIMNSTLYCQANCSEQNPSCAAYTRSCPAVQ
jgi:hypothetical protein